MPNKTITSVAAPSIHANKYALCTAISKNVI